MVIPSSYSSSSKQASCEADRIQKILASIVGNPSDELKRLILYIKSHGLEWRYFLALNTDGILYVVDPDHAPGDDYIIREELKEYLTTYGASLTETLSPTVDYLITNTPDSGTAKNKKAIELGIKRITEAQFNEMIGRIT